MAELKSYTCSKCAGVLMFDSDQEFFECPFCGTAFNVVDFHADELLEQANECLAQSDFNTAKVKYGKVLEKEPDNYQGLLGMILSEAKVSSIEGLQDHNFYTRCDIKAVRRAVDTAVKKAPEQAVPFFEKISDLVSLDEELRPLVEEIKVVAKEITPETFKLSQHVVKVESRTNTAMLILTGITFVVMFVMVLLIVGYSSADWYEVIVVLLGIGCTIGIYVGLSAYTKNRKDKAVGAYNMIVKAKNDSYGTMEKIDNIRERYADEYAGLWKLQAKAESAVRVAAKADKKPSAASIEATMDSNSEKVILCDKCAARLTLNKEKRVYECGSCGVAYGVSLFFGMPLEKALNAINMGQFEAAEKRFSNLLMLNPADFDGLLGRVLCTGKWNNVSNISVSEDLRPITYKNLLVMADKAAEAADESDKEYFGDLKKLLSLLEELYLIDYKEKAAGRMLEDLEVKDRLFSSEKYSSTASNYREKWHIQDELQPYVSRKKDLEYNFNKTKEKLLGMRNSSALCK